MSKSSRSAGLYNYVIFYAITANYKIWIVCDFYVIFLVLIINKSNLYN